MTPDEYGMELAKTASLRSKDPSTKVGCAIIRPDGTVASIGYNGTARGLDDSYWVQEDRGRKLAVTIHAEVNAILNARDPSLSGCTAYIYPLPVCCHCAAVLAQSGIHRVVAYSPEPGSRWRDSADIGVRLMAEAGIVVDYL